MTDMNFETARFNMVEQQVRPWNVLDAQILDLIAKAPREDYVSETYKAQAYSDLHIPLAHGELMMEPRVEARALQALDIKPGDTILEIGTGSGFLTSLLATLGQRVASIEIHSDMSDQAGKVLSGHGHTNISLEVGDAAQGWDHGTKYDVVILTGSVPILPETFKKSLTQGGRLFAIVGESPVMEACLYKRIGEYHWSETLLFETDLPPLINAVTPPKFSF